MTIRGLHWLGRRGPAFKFRFGAVAEAFGRAFVLAAVLASSGLTQAQTAAIPPSPMAERTEDLLVGTGLSLADLIGIAESSSPNLRQATADIEMARGRTDQAGRYPNPILMSGTQQMNAGQSQYVATISQEIVTKHKLDLQQCAAEREIFQAELQFLRVRFNLLTTVRQSYYATLAAQKRVDVLSRLVEIARKSQAAAQKLQDAGEGTKGDTLLLSIELEKAEVALENAETALLAWRRQLSAVIGQRGLRIDGVSGLLTVSLDEFATQIAVDDYVPYNAEVQIAEQEISRTRFLARRADVEPFPNVSVQSGYMYQVEPLHNYGILQISVPLPLWNKNQGNRYAAQAAVGRAMETVQQVQNDIARQMADATGRFRQADQQVHRFEDRILPQARESVSVSQQGFQQGQFDFLRLLQSQRALVESSLGYLTALENRWMAASELAGIAQVEVFP
ncbi:TolC family protein [Planctellipticum variicoloris]|uniref:TolC family protein n=1 Tax=Planctellipticum variicoloris TaxID=3064265 RepID=UPI002C542E15|nr:TolC family protein [Planctomycetaceae bacterium SH412]HTN00638.1 TolC family protein [Planctomycetaceae bacterium]